MIDVVDQLRAAQRDRSELAGVRARLETLLQGRSVADVEAAANEAREVLNQLDMGSNAGAADRIDLDELGRRLTDAEKTHSELGGRLRSIDGASVDVAGAEASVAEARRELQRVRTLADVLDYTVEHLAKAESEAFRRVAPLVAENVTEHIAKVTNGRYVEALVDPEALEVTVRDASGRYRPAGALSHGTTEQIFLLLRLAMVKVLTKPDETCPVLVDEATVHADDSRTEALLSLLHDASAERQIVVFTQETAVLDWARRNLGQRDKVIELLAAS